MYLLCRHHFISHERVGKREGEYEVDVVVCTFAEAVKTQFLAGSGP
jgi:hypothetical protein